MKASTKRELAGPAASPGASTKKAAGKPPPDAPLPPSAPHSKSEDLPVPRGLLGFIAPELVVFPLFLFVLATLPVAVVWVVGPLVFLPIYLGMEVAWSLYQRGRRHLVEHKIESSVIYSVVHDPFAHSMEILARFLHYVPALPTFDAGEFLSQWFSGAPVDKIQRGDLKSLVAYGFFYVSRPEFESRWGADTLEDLTQRTETALGVKLWDGPSGKVKARTHLWDPMPFLPLPLALYLFSELSGWVAHILLTAWGFRVHRSEPSTKAALAVPWCYVRQPPGRGGAAGEGGQGPRASTAGAAASEDESHPLVFCHGLGIGLLPYLPFIWRWIATFPRRPMVLMPLGQVAVRLTTSRPVSADQSAEDLERMLAEMSLSAPQGYSECVVVGHSYGTFVASQMCRRSVAAARRGAAEREARASATTATTAADGPGPAVSVSSVVLIDPVCLMLVHPTLTYKFVYQPLRRTVTDLSRFLFSRELMISATMCRRFFWSTLMLWPDEYPNNGGAVVLANADMLLPTTLIADHVERQCPHVTLLHHPAHDHGEFLAEPGWQSRIIRAANDLMTGRGRVHTVGAPPPFELPAWAQALIQAVQGGHPVQERRANGPLHPSHQTGSVDIGTSPLTSPLKGFGGPQGERSGSGSGRPGDAAAADMNGEIGEGRSSASGASPSGTSPEPGLDRVIASGAAARVSHRAEGKAEGAGTAKAPAADEFMRQRGKQRNKGLVEEQQGQQAVGGVAVENGKPAA